MLVLHFRASLFVFSAAAVAACGGPTKRASGEVERAPGALAVSGDLTGAPDRTLEPGAPVGVLRPYPWVAVAYGGGVHLAVFERGNNKLAWARVRARDRQLLDPVARPFHGQEGPCQWSRGTAVAYGSGLFLVVWAREQALCAVRIRPDGTVMDPQPLVIATATQPSSHRELAIASDGTDFYVTWPHPEPGSTVVEDRWDISGLRIRAHDGASLDGTGRPLVAAPLFQRRPAMAFDGSNYFLVWQDGRDGGTIRGLRLRPSDGQSVDSEPFVVTGAAGTGPRPQVAAGQGQLLVTYQEGSVIRARRVRAADAHVLDAMSIDIANPGFGVTIQSDQLQPKVAWDGRAYLVGHGFMERGADMRPVWDFRTIRVTPAGEVLGPPVVHERDIARGFATYFQGGTFVSYGDDQHLVGWFDSGRSTGSVPREAWRAAGVDPATGSAAGTPFSFAMTAPEQEAPAVSFDGRQHLVSWQEWNGSTFFIRAARIRDGDGARLDPDGFTVSAPLTQDQARPRSASNGRNHLVVWMDGRSLRAARVDGDTGAVLDQPGLSWLGYPVRDPWSENQDYAVASNGTDYLVAWSDSAYQADGPASIFALRISGSDGSMLDGGPKVVRTPLRRGSASLVYSGSHYLLSWCEAAARSILSLRLTADGAPVEPATVLTANLRDGLYYVTSAVANGVALVTWSNQGRLVRIADGVPVGNVFNFNDPSLEWLQNGATGLAFDGEHFVALGNIATLSPTGLFGSVRPRLIRITPAGTLVDTRAILLDSGSAWTGGLGAGAAGRLLATYGRLDPDAPFNASRIHMRLLGPWGSAPDAGAPDAATVPDAVTPEVGASDGGAVDVAADATEPVEAAPFEAVPVPPDVQAETAPEVGADVGPADAGVDAHRDGVAAEALDGLVAPDAGTDAAMRDTVADTTIEAGRPDAFDAHGDRPGDGESTVDSPACACDVGGARRGPGSPVALTALALAGVLARRRRRFMRGAWIRGS